MFGRKNPSRREVAPVDGSPDGDAVLDALASVLRTYGRKSFDVERTTAADAEQACEGWARHLLLGTPPQLEPGSESETDAGGRLPPDLRGVVRFFGGHRSEEQSYVTQSLADLRGAVWAMIQSLRSGMTDDQFADSIAADHLQRLAQAMEGGSHENLRRQVTACVEGVGKLLDQREERHRRQIEVLAQQLSQLRGELERAWREASLDPLTELANRASLDAHIERMLDTAFLFSDSIWFLMIDIDHFKQVNDRFGHQAGDAVLRGVSGRLATCFPRKNDVVARYGGEEFAVVVQLDDRSAVQTLAERTLQALRDLETPYGDEILHVTASIGASELRRAETAESWIGRADAALYQAKQAGRDRLMLG